MSHALHYGTSVFEGVRVYDTANGPCAFRLGDHIRRLFEFGTDVRFRAAVFVRRTSRTRARAWCAATRLTNAYVRPIAFLGECGMSVSPSDESHEHRRCGRRLSVGRLSGRRQPGERRRRLRVELGAARAQYRSQRPPRRAAITFPVISSAAKRGSRGFAEGIGLGTDGRLSEGAGENLFLVKNGRILTPPAASSILVGITRDTVIKLAHDEGIETVEQALPREALYVADEVFLTGTAAEITPVRSVDGIATRAGGPGTVTRALAEALSRSGRRPLRTITPTGSNPCAAEYGERHVSPRPRTLFEKVWDAHVVAPGNAGPSGDPVCRSASGARGDLAPGVCAPCRTQDPRAPARPHRGDGRSFDAHSAAERGGRAALCDARGAPAGRHAGNELRRQPHRCLRLEQPVTRHRPCDGAGTGPDPAGHDHRLRRQPHRDARRLRRARLRHRHLRSRARAGDAMPASAQAEDIARDRATVRCRRASAPRIWCSPLPRNWASAAARDA